MTNDKTENKTEKSVKRSVMRIMREACGSEVWHEINVIHPRYPGEGEVIGKLFKADGKIDNVPGIVCTDSVMDIMRSAGAYWLAGVVAEVNASYRIGDKYNFQSWRLNVNKDHTGALKMFVSDGKGGERIIAERKLNDNTPFPEGDWEFYAVNGGDFDGRHVLMCPGDY